eukprot:TRINITY_DN6684_c0_g1_i1.p1 TRINITY_DN6684_c0_g1~~TRINITY_DN6684_c0_g1_i1.p1  ORF type:complete len:780 (+),score=212.85 TRINITY_DN6684_c0_g1_i1:75-2414(+)
MRIFIKGGSWKNTEDEILKAAVMKYGKNQWARVASLLPRKSSKQCKARWYEWLDPSIKKTEWTKEEEEKLLHLAKLMPCQWRTIAPIVGRTAAQCLEHYEKLLDQAQGKDESYDPENDPRRLRPGEIDPHPETKPARPDALDMDEDEKEMLSEARARLANTKGKKAKRKAREKQLEEARRIAIVQKRRELLAAGIDIPERERVKRVKRKGPELGTEIPFQHVVPVGFFDVAEEEVESKRRKLDFSKPISAEQFEGKPRQEVEKIERRKDKRRQEESQKKNLSDVFSRVNKLNDPEQVTKRNPLLLPEPQVTERELVAIAKGGTEVLQSVLAGQTPQHTPRPPDVVQMEAQNLARLQNAPTPLHGGENEELNEKFHDFSGATPQRLRVETPNALASPAIRAGGTTPGVAAGGAGGRTPVRDDLRINEEGQATPDVRPGSNLNKVEQRKAISFRNKLAAELAKLPEPTNEYTLQLSLTEEQKELLSKDDDEFRLKPQVAPDSQEVRERKRAAERAREEAAWKTQAVKRNLPRPSYPPPPPEPEDEEEPHPEDYIDMEVHRLTRHDIIAHPKIQRKRKRGQEDVQLTSIPDEYLAQAAALLEQENEELQAASPLYEKTPEGKYVLRDMEKYVDTCEEADRTFIFLPNPPKYINAATASNAERIAAARTAFHMAKDALTVQTEKAVKLEERIKLLTTGYVKRSETLSNALQEVYAESVESAVELACYEHLRESERRAMAQRLARAQEDVAAQEEREQVLQKRYKALADELADLRAVLAAKGKK